DAERGDDRSQGWEPATGSRLAPRPTALGDDSHGDLVIGADTGLRRVGSIVEQGRHGSPIRQVRDSTPPTSKAFPADAVATPCSRIGSPDRWGSFRPDGRG